MVLMVYKRERGSCSTDIPDKSTSTLSLYGLPLALVLTTMSSIQPPIAPRIPQTNVQSLIPRLTTTINDIDSFRSLLAQGSHDGTMPNWYVPPPNALTIGM
jgi:hypothetical protein